MGDICSKCMYMFGTFIVGFYIDRVCICHIYSRVIHSQFMYEFVTFMVEFHIHSLRTSYIHGEFVY